MGTHGLDSFSALGLMFADLEHQCIRAFYQPLDTLDLDALNATLAALRDESDGLLAADGYREDARRLELSSEVKYIGQNAALSVAIASLPVTADAIERLAEDFAEAHEATFGYRSDEERLQIVSLKAVGRGIPDAPRLPERVTLAQGFRPDQTARRAYFGPEHGWFETPVLGRSDLGEAARSRPMPGPMIVEEYDCTTVVRPGWSAAVDGWTNIVLTRQDG